MTLMDNLPLPSVMDPVQRIVDDPWDLRKPIDLLRFACEMDLEDSILDECGDTDQVNCVFDHLPQSEAVELIESYIRINNLFDCYNAWKQAV